MKKIVFGITSLEIGGAERVLVDIVNKLKTRYDITIFTLYASGTFEKELDPDIKLISLYNRPYKKFSKIKQKIIPIYVLNCGKKIYKKYLEDKYDVEIAFLEGPITRIFSYGKSKKKIVWVHNDIKNVFGNDIKSKLKLNIDKKIYTKYDKIIFVSEDNKKSFNDQMKNKDLEEKEDVIYNYINKERIIQKSNEELKEEKVELKTPSIVTLSRLVEQKALDRLINVHKRLIDDGISNYIYILGEGPEKKKLEKKIEDLKVQDTFKLIGKRDNPYPYVKKADYIALLSYYEGYPMCLEEAKILNKKILATDTASREVLKNYNKNIIIKNDEEAIYNALKQVLQKKITFKEIENNYNNENLIDKIAEVL